VQHDTTTTTQYRLPPAPFFMQLSWKNIIYLMECFLKPLSQSIQRKIR